MRSPALFTLALLALSTSPLALSAQDVDLQPLSLDAAAQGTAGTAPTVRLSADDIARSQGATLQDVLRGVPSVTATRRGDMLNSGVTIRGFGANYHYPDDPATKFVVDGDTSGSTRIYQNASGMISDPALLRQVDVSTGPLASLEYGSGITGGAVSAQTINGSDLTEGRNGFRFRQMLGAHSNGNGWVTSSTAAWQANERFDMLLNFTRRAQDTQEDGAGQDIPRPGFNLPSLLAKARFKIDETNTLTFSHNRFQTSERNVPWASATGLSNFGNVNREREGATTGLSWTHAPAGNDLIDAELRLSYTDQVQDIELVDPALFPLVGDAEGRHNIETTRLSLKNTARFRTGDIGHTLRAGLEWTHEDRARDGAVIASGKDKRLAFFAIDRMDFGNELVATLGLRLENQKLTNSGVLAGAEQSRNARTLGLGLEKGLGHGFSVFGSVTYSEALPTFDVIGSAGENVQQARTWEGGVKYFGSDLIGAGDQLTASATAYRNDVWNGIFGTGSNATLKMKGVELSADYRAAAGWYARGVANLSDHETLSGAEWLRYGYTTGNTASLTLGQTFGNGVDLSWTVSGQEGITIGANDHKGFGVHDVKVSYTPKAGVLAGMTVDFGVENVFDKQYHHASTGMSRGAAVTEEPGRNLRLTVSKTF